jgi:hypothetical protein
MSRIFFRYGWLGAVQLFFVLFFCRKAQAENSGQWVSAIDAQGNTVYLADNRKPALYTQNFGDCLGNPSLNVSLFNAAFYRDNMTVVFHLQGRAALQHESLMSASIP